MPGATLGRSVDRQGQGGQDEFAQQRRDGDQLAARRQLGAHPRIDEQGAHLDPAQQVQVVLFAGGHPDPPSGWHHPTALGGIDDDHAAERMDQLRLAMAMGRHPFAMGVVLGHGVQAVA